MKFFLSIFLFIVISLSSCSKNTIGCASYGGRMSTTKYKDRNKKMKIYRKSKKVKFELYRHRSEGPMSN